MMVFLSKLYGRFPKIAVHLGLGIRDLKNRLCGEMMKKSTASFPLSGSPLEEKLAHALTVEGIAFEQQYRVYDSHRDSLPKYTLDFVIRAEDRLINIECDGMFHKDRDDIKRRDEDRNAYLFARGFDVLRFDTVDIKYNINFCVNMIKKSIASKTGQIFEFKPENLRVGNYRTKNTDFVKNVDVSTELDDVSIYAAAHALSYDKELLGVTAYRLHDVRRDRYSEVFITIHEKKNIKQCQSLSVLEALTALKKPCRVTIYTNSKWLVNVCNADTLVESAKKLSDTEIFIRIANELAKHSYKFIFVQKGRSVRFDNKPFNELISRVLQKISQVRKTTI